MNEFSFNGHSSREFGLYITGEVYNGAEKDMDIIEIKGRNGSLTRDNKRFLNLDIPYHAFIRNRLAVRTRAIKAWLLAPSGYHMLEDTYDRDYVRMAYFKGPFTFTQHLQRFGETDLIFSCKPMMFSRVGLRAHRISAHGDIINPEAFESKPYVKIYGSGAGRLYFNNNSLQFSNIAEYIELDSDLGQAYKDGQLLNNAVIGEIPTLQSGRTHIEWEGGITSIEITPRWCTL